MLSTGATVVKGRLGPLPGWALYLPSSLGGEQLGGLFQNKSLPFSGFFLLLQYERVALQDLGGGPFRSIYSFLNTFLSSYCVTSTFLSRRAELSNMVATSHMWLLSS